MNFKTICAECKNDVLPIVKTIEDAITVEFACKCGSTKAIEVPETFKVDAEKAVDVSPKTKKVKTRD